MNRPRKPRLIDGVQLVDNLYPDNKGRRGRYRYRRPDGSWKTFQAASVEQANRAAEEANATRDTWRPMPKKDHRRGHLPYYVDQYMTWREQTDPSLLEKRSWQNRRYALLQFADYFRATPVNQLTWPPIRDWWETLNHYQQKARHAELRRFFNWLMGRGMGSSLQYNPFTTSDDRPRLLLKARPGKRRDRMTLPEFWAIYHRAGRLGYHGLQTAMAISLITTLRQGDILRLQFGDIDGDVLRVTVGKSVGQRGSAAATRLSWNLADYPTLRDVINRARESSLQHERCPYIVHCRPKRRNKSRVKTHRYQMLKELLASQFAECRGESATTFHEIRSLSSALYRQAGYEIRQIQELMAHTDEATTLGYQDGHALPFTPVGMQLGDIGGEF